MNKFLSVLVLGSALALSACGGDSDSSGSDNNTPAKPTTPTSPTAPANPEPTAPTSTTCKTAGTNITVPNNSSCTFSIPNLNKGAVETYKCSNGTLSTPLGTSGGTTTLNGYEISCAK